MVYEEDFANENIIEFEIEDKPVTAGEESDWINECMEFDEETKKYKQNLKKITQCKVRNIVKVPYDKETINNLIGLEKEWKNLSKEERWNLLSKLKPKFFDKIIKKINSLDSDSDEIKKN